MFLEVNPRLPVEHTVTEEVTGIDLVALQLRIASGATLADLGLADGPPPARGAAVQARVNLETVAADGTVRPGGGRLASYDPPSGPGGRVDGYGYGYGYAGYETSPRYDPWGDAAMFAAFAAAALLAAAPAGAGPPPSLRSARVISLGFCVRDLEAQKAWYVGKLGMIVVVA